MKSQPCKKTTLKLHLDRNALNMITKSKPSIPPSSKCSQKTTSPTNTTGCTTSSSKNNFRYVENKSNPSTCSEDPTKSQLIQYLLQENQQLQRQNEDKEQLINFLSSGKSPKRRLVLNTERSTEIKNQKLPQINTKSQVEIESSNTPFCFTFCQLETQSQKSVRVNKLPKEFQIVPNKKRYFI